MYDKSPDYTALAKEITNGRRKKSPVGLLDYHKYQVGRAKQMRASTKPRQRTQVDIASLLQRERDSASLAFELNLSNHTINVPSFGRHNE